MRLLTTTDAQTLRFAAMAREHVEKLGRRIRERREELGLSQDELARKIGLKATGNYVSRWERAIVEPEGDYLELLAKALDTTIPDLMAGPVEERQPKGETPDPFARNGNGAPGDTAESLRAELQELRSMLQDLGRAIDAVSEASEARSEQSDSKLEELLRGVGQLLRRAA